MFQRLEPGTGAHRERMHAHIDVKGFAIAAFAG
jgi:hypothetical protein